MAQRLTENQVSLAKRRLNEARKLIEDARQSFETISDRAAAERMRAFAEQISRELGRIK